MTVTVLFGERIPDFKPKMNPRAGVILSSEVITSSYTRDSLHEIFEIIQVTYHACFSQCRRRKLKDSEVSTEFHLQRFNFALTEANDSERTY